MRQKPGATAFSGFRRLRKTVENGAKTVFAGIGCGQQVASTEAVVMAKREAAIVGHE